jgi:SAM-dependent methyltransferase
VYYRKNLALIHHFAYGGHADLVAPGVLALLEPYRGGVILELGCGSGALTAHLVEAGHDVIATDASDAFLELARVAVPGVDFRRLTLPDDPIPEADAIVSVGHALSYLDSRQAIESGLRSCASALRPSGVLAVDLLDLSYGTSRTEPATYSEVSDDWAIFLSKHLEPPDRFVRELTTFVRSENGTWRRDDETHHNTLVNCEELAGALRETGMDVEVRSAFGNETPEEGVVVLTIGAS